MESVFGSILGIVIAGAIGVITYSWQEHLKRRTALAERRQTLYEELTRNLFELLVAKSGADRSLFISQIEKGWLFASDKVLRACYGFLETYDQLDQAGKNAAEQVKQSHEVRKRFEHDIAKMFLAMREDLRRTSLQDAWARKHVRIYNWGIISKV